VSQSRHLVLPCGRGVSGAPDIRISPASAGAGHSFILQKIGNDDFLLFLFRWLSRQPNIGLADKECSDEPACQQEQRAAAGGRQCEWNRDAAQAQSSGSFR